MDLDAIFAAAGLTATQTNDGLEIRDGQRLAFTLIALSNVNTKILYPEGGEYTHSTLWNTPLDDRLIKKQMIHILMAKLDIAKGKL